MKAPLFHALVTLNFFIVSNCINAPVVSIAQEIPAFPGAEGFGSTTSGGRGGRGWHVHAAGSDRYDCDSLGAVLRETAASGRSRPHDERAARLLGIEAVHTAAENLRPRQQLHVHFETDDDSDVHDRASHNCQGKMSLTGTEVQVCPSTTQGTDSLRCKTNVSPYPAVCPAPCGFV